MIDISFGAFGIVPLLVAHRLIRCLNSEEAAHHVATEKPLQPI
ncbi:hypothetical protein [Dactylosporangium fulvum]|uniref:Uncharacterized protein n=1 Tax=Dactylosporangium fulvum TaxID=53359 RepID=A0ABY5VY22_9ACTN|nr:hypothetical protein [Dactylosporangium fulvum]UWP81751.1 hypothetical protein Dfulv_42750 [Dactylosporangium fulvum]